MKNRVYMYIIGFVFIFVISFYIGRSVIFNNNKNEEIVKENILEEVSNEEEKISPNATIIFKKYYSECSHTKEEKKSITEKLVNLTQEELQREYKEWKIEKFSKSEIVLTKNEDEYCNEHYVLKNTNGYITVFSIDKGRNEQIYLSTDIAVEYLPETDKENLENGIYIYGSEKLTEILQDFE